MRNLRAREENQRGKQEPYVSIGDNTEESVHFSKSFY